MRDQARAVIIGGGVGGASIAYHLTLLGWDDVVLVERDQLTSGSTFHSAGLVGQLRSSVTLTRMMMYGADLYRRLHDETGHDPGWHEVGSLRLASTPARWEELTRQAGWAQTFGLPLELVSTEQALERFHGLFDPTDVLGAVWLPTDGWLNPTDLTMALAAGARSRGAEIATMTRVTGIGVEERGGRRRVTHVETDKGRIACEVVVNAGGMFAHEIGRMVGVNVPIIPMAHQYALTRPAQPDPQGPADHARPGPPRLLPRGGGRAGGRRLRARPGPVVRRRPHPLHLQQHAAATGLGSLLAPHGGRHHARAVPRRGRGDAADQRPGGLHARWRVHPG